MTSIAKIQVRAIETFVAAEGSLVDLIFGGEECFRAVKWPVFLQHATPKLLDAARVELRKLPRNQQGLVVVVSSRTSGATWVAEVYDASGEYRRDCMLADEGMDDPHLWLAEQGGAKMAERLGCKVKVVK